MGDYFKQMGRGGDIMKKVEKPWCRLRDIQSIFLYLVIMTVSFLSLQVKNFTGPMKIPNFSNWTFVEIS